MINENKITLVIGSSRGIGRGIAQALAENNRDVATQHNNNKRAAEDVSTFIVNTGLKSISLQADFKSILSISEES